MNILISGIAGYLGSVLSPLLLLAGHKVTGVDNFLYNQTSLTDCCRYRNFTLIRGDCRDGRLMGELIKDADVIIPLAAIVGAPACDRDRTAAVSTNLQAINLILGLRSQQQRIIFPTTNSGYGIGTSEPCTEESPLKPISLYGQLKVDAERQILEAGNAITFRFATLFGMSARMRTDLLVNDFVFRAVKDRYVVLFEAHFRRNYLHVRDAAMAFIYAIENFDAMKNRPYNVGLPDANLTKGELCGKIKEHIKDFHFSEGLDNEDPDKRNYLVNNDRILATGWRPVYSLDDGIEELIKGYQMFKMPWGNV